MPQPRHRHGVALHFATVVALLVVGSFSLLGLLVYQPMRSVFEEQAIEGLLDDIDHSFDNFENLIGKFGDQEDRPLLTAEALTLAQAMKNGDIITTTRSQRRIEESLSRTIARNPSYLEALIVGGNEENAECVRENGIVRIVPQHELISDLRDHLLAATGNLEPYDVFFSEIEYDKRPGDRSRLARPILRFVTPIHSLQTHSIECFYIVILDVGEVLREFSSQRQNPNRVFLHEAHSGNITGFREGDPNARIYRPEDDDYPNVSAVLTQGKIQTGHGIDQGTRILQEKEMIWEARTLRLGNSNPPREWSVMTETPYAPIRATVRNAILKNILSGLLITFFCAILAGYIASVYLARPISQISKELEAYTRGEEQHEPQVVPRFREMKILMDSFQALREQVNARTTRLEEALQHSRELEAERKKINERLSEGQRLEAIGTLVSGIAHDFNNILAGVMGYAELLQRSPELSPKLRRFAEAIQKAGIRARDLIKSLLTFSRKSAARMETFRIHDVLEESFNILRASIPVTTRMSYTNKAPTGIKIFGNPTQIEQVILNLGTNAAHAATNPNPEVQISLEVCEVDEVFCATHPNLDPGPHGRITVQDNGTGMTEEVKNRLFEPFFTTKSKGKGTGLGLAVVHGIVNAHRGMITVYSELGRGSRFCIYLPLVSGELTTPEPTVISPKDPPKIDLKILVVDDDPDARGSASVLLQDLGYQVETSESSLEALATLLQRTEEFGLLITDETMPDMSGVQLCSALRQKVPELPVILSTGYSINLTSERLTQLQIADVLHKPYTRQELIASLHLAVPKSDLS